MFSVARYTHSTNTLRIISDATNNNWFMGFHGNHMHKWYFGGYLTEESNGKDTKFHIHTANMNTNDQGNTFFDGARVGSVNGNGAITMLFTIVRKNYNLVVTKPMWSTQNVKSGNSSLSIVYSVNPSKMRLKGIWPINGVFLVSYQSLTRIAVLWLVSDLD